MANPIDISYGVVRETVAGTTPATPAYKRFPHILGDTLQLTNESIISEIMMPGRSSAGAEMTAFRVTGTLKTELHRDTAIDTFFESTCGNLFATDVLKANENDNYMTVEKIFKEGGVPRYRQFKGVQSTKTALSCAASGKAEVSFDMIGMTDARSDTMITGATYAAPSTTRKLTGKDVTVTIAGLTAQYASLELTVESEREPAFALGSDNAIEIGASGPRKTSLSVTLFRRDWEPETLLLGGGPVAVTVTIGGVGTGYKFEIPAASLITAPQDEEDGSKLFVKLDFVAGYDNTALTDFMITRL